MPLNRRLQPTKRASHGCEGNCFKMGCNASTPTTEHRALNDSYSPLSRGISMTSHAQDHLQDVDKFHVVPLTGSRYGIMKIETPGDADVYSKEIIHGDFMREALKRLDQLDVEPDSGPKSWLVNTSMLEDLKPGLEKYFCEMDGLNEVVKPHQEMKLISQVHYEKYDLYTDVSENTLLASSQEQTVSSVETGSQLQGKSARPSCQSYVSAVPPPKDRSKSSKGSKVVRKLSKVFSFGSQSKRGPKSTQGLKTGGDGPAFQNDGYEDSMKSFESRSSLFDSDFLASLEDVMRQVTQDDLQSLPSHTVADMPMVQAPDEESKGTNVQKCEAQFSKLTCASGLPSAPATKHSPVVKRTMVKRINPLEKFEKVFLPGSEKSVILYTTSLRGVRKTFEDCGNARTVLQSFGVNIDERDISMHQDFRNELRGVMGKPVPVPQLLIDGRQIGGVEEVLRLHEDGLLGELLEGMPKDDGNGKICDGCGGVRFVPCLDCSGSRKLVNGKEVVRCPCCNENGLIQCPLCCY